MGNEGNKTALVSMTNGDIYHISLIKAEFLKSLMRDSEGVTAASFTDTKNQFEVTVNINQISSIVVRTEYNG